jgi:hypothetical protein
MRAEERIPMPDKTTPADRKAALLARLAAEPVARPSAGVVLPQGSAARLAAIVAEIDETVLPRVLLLHVGRQEVGRITVSHRHVIAVDLPGRPRPASDPDRFALLLAARFAEIAATPGELVLAIARRTGTPQGAEPSCSLAALRAALSAATTRTAFDRLRDLVSARAQAQLVWTDPGAPSQFSGLQDWAPTLQAMARAFEARAGLTTADALIGPQNAEGLAFPISGQQILILARLDRQGLAAVMPFAAGLAAIAAWQDS